jgi:hypothetical protein
MSPCGDDDDDDDDDGDDDDDDEQVRAQDNSHKRAKLKCSLKFLKAAQAVYRGT